MLLQALVHISCIFSTVNKPRLPIFGFLSGTYTSIFPHSVAEGKKKLFNSDIQN